MYVFGYYSHVNNGKIIYYAPEDRQKPYVNVHDSALHGDGYYLFDAEPTSERSKTVLCHPVVKLANTRNMAVAIAERVSTGLARGMHFSNDIISLDRNLYEDEVIWLCYELASALIYQEKEEKELLIWRICQHAGIEYENMSVSAEMLMQCLVDRSMNFFDMLMYANTIVKSKPETAKLFPANNFFDDEHCCDALVFIDIKNMERENFVAINDDVAYCRWKKAIPSMMHISEKNNFGFRVSFDFDESKFVYYNRKLVEGGLICSVRLYDDDMHTVSVRFFNKDKLNPFYQAHNLMEYEEWLVPVGLPDWKVKNLGSHVDRPEYWMEVSFANGSIGAYTLQFMTEKYPGKCLNAKWEKDVDEYGEPRIIITKHNKEEFA